MRLHLFEIFHEDGSSIWTHQWARDEDEAFALMATSKPQSLNGFQPQIHDILFEVVQRCECPVLVYWMGEAEA